MIQGVWLLSFFLFFFLIKSGTAAPLKSGKEFPKVQLSPSPDGWFRVQGWWSGPPRGRLHWVNTAALAGGGWQSMILGTPTAQVSTEKCEHENGPSRRSDRLLQGSNGLKIACLLEPRLFLGTTAWWRGGGGQGGWRQINVTLGYAGHSQARLTSQGQHVYSVWGVQGACAIKWLAFAFWGTAPPVTSRCNCTPAGCNHWFCARLCWCES